MNFPDDRDGVGGLRLIAFITETPQTAALQQPDVAATRRLVVRLHGVTTSRPGGASRAKSGVL